LESWAPQDCELQDKAVEVTGGAKEGHSHANGQEETQLGPSASPAWTLKETSLRHENPQVSPLPTPLPTVHDEVNPVPSGVTLGAQPNSIHFMMESSIAANARGFETMMQEELRLDGASLQNSQETSSLAADSPSGDENADLNRHVDKPKEAQTSERLPGPAMYLASSPLKLAFAKTSLTDGPTLAESELDGMV
jgi:hypothetical protein